MCVYYTNSDESSSADVRGAIDASLGKVVFISGRLRSCSVCHLVVICLFLVV